MNRPTSLYDRLFSQPRRLGWIALACAAMLGLPFLLAWGNASLEAFLQGGRWRGLLAGPVVITYILLVSPAITRVQNGVLVSLRPIVELDDRAFDGVVRNYGLVTPVQELLAFAIGSVVGVLQVLAAREGQGLDALTIYWLVTTAVLYGLLAWVIFAALRGTSLVSALHRQPMRVDPLDTSPFSAVGRQSLLVSLVFVGGITLSLLFLAQQRDILRNPMFWLVYLPLVAVPVALFFLNMRPTHRVLADAKRTELGRVTAQLNDAYRRLADRMASDRPTEGLAGDAAALAVLEARLRGARTWPYDTAMLRTLVVSVIIPAATVVVRNLLERLLG